MKERKGTKRFLVGGFFIMAVLLVIMEIVSVREINTLAGLTEKMYRHPFTVNDAVLEANSSIVAMYQHMKDIALAQNANERELAISKVDAEEKRVYEHFEIVMDRFLGDKSKIRMAQNSFADWKAIRSEVIELTRAEKFSEATAITKGKGAEHVALITSQMDGLISFAHDKAATFFFESKAAHSQSKLELRLLMAGLLFTIAVVAVVVILNVGAATRDPIPPEAEEIISDTAARQRKLTIIILAVIVLLSGGAIFGVVWDYRSQIKSAEETTQHQAQILAEHAARSFDAIQLTLQRVVDQVERFRGGTEQSLKEINNLLQSLTNGIPQIRGLVIVAEDGMAEFSNIDGLAGINVGDRRYFQIQKESTNAGFFIGQPLKGRARGQWFLSTSVRINRPDGSFGGVVVAAVDKGYFDNFYNYSEQEKEVSAGLIVENGNVFSASTNFAAGMADVAGYSLANRLPINSVLTSGKTHTDHRWLFDRDVERISSLTTVAGTNLLVVASIPWPQVISDWSDNLVILGSVFLLVIVAGGWAFSLQISVVKATENLETKVFERTNDLAKRVKEMTGLSSFLEILHRSNGFSENSFQTAIEVLPSAWYYPEITCARLTINDVEYSTKNFKETAWKLSSDIVAGENRVGKIEVCFLKETPELDEGPFLKEERDLIDQIAKRTGEKITHMRSEEALRRSQKMDAIGQLSGGLAHDLNNVLAIISINAGILARKVTSVPEVSKNIEIVLKSINRASDLTRKMLDYSRTDAGETKRVSVNEFIQGMEYLISKSLTPAITLETDLAKNVWHVDIDSGDLENAILNLALNARDAMPDGGTLVIETTNKVIDQGYVDRYPGSMAGEFVMVSVGDTGTGMTPEALEKAFEPFFTTKDVGKGTGLGLSIVYGFVQRSGGHVKIYSELGEGTTLNLYLPRARSVSEDKNSQPFDPNVLPGGDETILVVDDEKQLVDAAVDFLGSLGYRTVTAANGKEALEILKQGPAIDLLFSDVIMSGGMDGYQLAIDALNDRPDLKVLLTSGFTRKREEFANGDGLIASELAQSMLHKPYNIAELAVAVRGVLDQRGSE